MANPRNALVFGPQALSFGTKDLDLLRLKLSSPKHQWALEVLCTLPSVLQTVVNLDRELGGLKQCICSLEGLSKVLRSDASLSHLFPLASCLLTPLVVVSHLLLYSSFLESMLPDDSDGDPFPSSFVENTIVSGLCTGLLSASSVASSANLTDLARNGAVAIKLGMLVGAVVDSEQRLEQASTSISVSWGGTNTLDHLRNILDKFPNAYVSVYTDETRVTITCSVIVQPDIVREVRGIGMRVTPLALSGRFHWLEHQKAVERLSLLCMNNSEFQFVDTKVMKFWLAVEDGPGSFSDTHNLHTHVLRHILQYPSRWVDTFSSLHDTEISSISSRVFCFGDEPCVPPTIARKLKTNQSLIRFAGLDIPKLHAGISPPGDSASDLVERINEEYVAVIGMSCTVAGAEDIGEFWEMLCSGRSQHSQAPPERLPPDTPWRQLDSERVWYGNFIKNFDAFDHKFFKKSPREMASTDPQHRLLLQLAYQAVQQAGYLAGSSFGKHTGCFIGIGNVEYNRNIACYPATAYSATGNLRAFAAGKISHYFGWTGPSVTVDTACSSSTVALHQACRAILADDCNTALAGGVNLFTHMEWFQNLAGASFLSQTGQCKPFDIKADGYCRGEGAGIVVLKRLSSAVADGDQVLGVIASTRVYQNQNTTPITVPNAESLDELFTGVIKRAGLDPQTISFAEAHGTGTPIGDPAEYDGLRRALCRPSRPEALYLSSVKGHIGHTEHASGIISLIKVLLMLHEGLIPPQASFTMINPSIGAVEEDNITIPMQATPWKTDFRAALINNYGASGSNASMVVTEPPRPSWEFSRPVSSNERLYPFRFSGFDEKGLSSYIAKFREYLKQNGGSQKDLSAHNLSYQLFRQSNHSLPEALILKASSTEELSKQLQPFENAKQSANSGVKLPASRPVVLCFGGQITDFIGLERSIYDEFVIFRHHLDACNSACLSVDVGSIFPDIFQRAPTQDIVKLQTMLFSLQYSCAMAWIECGVKVDVVIGHSFGELTALCVSGVYSLIDAIQIVSQRARAVQDSWGADKGAMLAIEGDRTQVESLLTRARTIPGYDRSTSIACYNGPTSFTLAGSTAGIWIVTDVVADDPDFSNLRFKKLNVTNAYHSALVDPLLPQLKSIGQGIDFGPPKIAYELASETMSPGDLDADYFARHMRNPVFFNHAVQRIRDRYPNAIWLEAGSSSTVTSIASRALGNPESMHFQQVNLNSPDCRQSLVDGTVKLWKEGLRFTFWGHHSREAGRHTTLLLPPYQFEDTRHWLDYKLPPKSTPSAETPNQSVELSQGLTTFATSLDSRGRSARFRVNQDFPLFHAAVRANVVAKTAAVAPNWIQCQVALDALDQWKPDFKRQGFQVELLGVRYRHHLSVQPSSDLFLDITHQDDENLTCEWALRTTVSPGMEKVCSTGRIIAYSLEKRPDIVDGFDGLARLSGRNRCVDLLANNSRGEIMQGRNIYRAFEQVIDYQTMYRKLDKVVSTDTEVAARLHKAYEQTTWIDPVLTECFCQVSAIYANLMTEVLDLPEQSVYVCNGVGRWIRNPKFKSHSPISNEWEVFAIHHRTSETKIVSDVFAFDSRDGSLFEAILGVTFERVSVDDLRHHIEAYAAIDDSISSISNSTESRDQPSANSNSWSCPSSATSCDGSGVKASNTGLQSSRVSVTAEVREIVCNLSGLEPADIQPTSDLVELGIDSLMAMELMREVDTVFHCTLHNEQLLKLTDFQSLVACIETTVGHQTEPRSASSTKDDLAIPEDAHRSPQRKAKEVMTESSLRLDPTIVQELWGEVKWTTDDFIVRGLLDKYCSNVMPRSTEACILYILNAFEELGCRIKTAQPGERLDRAIHQPKHQRFVDLIYKLLVDEAGLITIGDAEIIRTDVAIPSQDPESLLDELIRHEPTHAAEHKLLKMVGPYFADCLVGKKDCLQLMFGTPEGRETVTAMYAKSPITGIWIQQLEHFLKELVRRLPKDGTTLNILEMGAGTGGTTSRIVPMLAALGVPIQYTMTDISGSLVATGRKRFKQYPFMKFEVLDIESEPSVQHLESQHVVLATNCVHATRDLNISLSNIQRILRPDGLLILLEMTEPVPWVDFIFGLVEGWWLFEDDRNYVLQSPSYWERKLHAVGFGYVDWTEGHLPESRLQRLIVANRSGSLHDPLAKSAPQSRPHSPNQPCSAPTSRQAILDGIISRYKDGFTGPTRCLAPGPQKRPNAQCVLVTGATGSLGSHMVEALTQRSNVSEVVCLNRLSAMDGNLRQQQTFGVRGIRMDHNMIARMVVIQTDMSKPQLGLSPETFDYLVNNVTSIVHSAWPMSLTRQIRGYEQQFKIFRNLLDLAKEIAQKLPAPMKVGFQFVSSLAVVANYPGLIGDAVVPEQLVTADSVPEGGYAEAKMVCEHLLHETLYRYPDSFSAMAVRVAQISGSTGAGYWSPTEYIAFLVKSSQTLGALPSLEGTLSWYPVDRVAETLSDLLLTDTAAGTSFIGHIDNPARQSWGEMISAFADCLGITTENIIPYPEWVARVRQFAGSVAENPALQLIDFFEQYFVAMSCGQLMLDTVKTRSHSTTMQTMKPVEKDLVRKYVGAWKRAGFLK